MLRAIFAALRAAPVFWYYIFKDFGKYIKEKGWTRFNYWGLHLFIGKFGGGKTISAVRRAYNICKTHKGVTVLTNLTLYGFPEDTKIIKLVNSSQILELPDKSIVLIDEIGSIFNSRDFASSKKSVPKPVYQLILQCRHRRIILLGTVQRWNLLDKQLRDIADTLTVCHSYFADPFARYTTCAEYDAQEYDKWFNNPLLPLRQLMYYSYVQTDELRSKYDTIEMVDSMLDKEYISDEEILANRAGTGFAPDLVGDKKTQRRLGREDGLYSSRLTAGDFNWILWENAPSEPVEVSARTRYNGREAEATVWADPDGTVHVEFRKPQRAVTAGQAVVLYLGDIVVGGGTILSAE